MEGFILKDFSAEVKAVEGERALNVTITTNTVDRSGDIVEPKGAKLVNFRKNPVVLMAHDYQGLPIGKASNLEKTENGINAKVTFPEEGVYPLADTVYNMYKQKYMRAWSIGFIPIKSEDIVDDDEKDKKGGCSGYRGRRFKTWELLEFSACAVPNNPDVSTNMVKKGIDIKPLKEAGFITIVENIVENEYLTKEVCPKCGADIEDDDNPEFSSCSKCDWDDSDFEKEESPDQVMVENIVTKPEDTEKFIRIPAKGEEGKHKGHKIRWMDVSTKEGIRGIYCIDCKKIITFVFAKDKGWTMAKAKKWMEDHEKIVSNYFLNIDMDSFKDRELQGIDWDDVKANIEKEELEDKRKAVGIFDINELANIVNENKELKEKIKDLELKAGAVLNAKNKSNLKNAQSLIQSVLDSAGEEEGQEGEEVKTNEKDDIVINLKDDEKVDPPKDKKTEEKTITIDEKILAEAVTKSMNYVLGITDK